MKSISVDKPVAATQLGDGTSAGRIQKMEIRGVRFESGAGAPRPRTLRGESASVALIGGDYSETLSIGKAIEERPEAGNKNKGRE